MNQRERLRIRICFFNRRAIAIRLLFEMFKEMLFVFLLALFMPIDSTVLRCARGCSELYLRRSLPSQYESQTITIVTGRQSVPLVSQIGSSPPVGLDIDLINLIGFMYGINFQYQYADFVQFIPTVQSNANIISISTMQVTPAREELVDFVQYFKTGSGFIAKSTYAGTVNELGDLCGKKVVVRANVTHQADVEKQNALCGANPITIVVVQTYPELIESVNNGTAEVGVSGVALLITSVRESNNTLKVVGKSYDIAPYGIAINKQNKELSCLFVNAINLLIRKKAYESILNRYSFSFKEFGICPSRMNLNGTTCNTMCLPKVNQCRANLS